MFNFLSRREASSKPSARILSRTHRQTLSSANPPAFEPLEPRVLFSAAFTDISADYEFSQAQIGGGGWVTGVFVHPQDDTVRYARTDVGGAYRWDNADQRWEQMVTPDSLPVGFKPGELSTLHPGVESIAFDPVDTGVVYMAFELPGVDTSSPTPTDGRVYRSGDGGLSWVDTNLSVNMDANGPARIHGERLAVDPNNTSVVYFGSTFDGVWQTTNAGSGSPSWSKLNLPGNAEGISGQGLLSVKIDPNGGTANGRSAVLYAATIGEGIFRSTNGGNGWTKITGGANEPGDNRKPTDLEIMPDGRVVVTFQNNGGNADNLWVYNPSTDAWVNRNPQNDNRNFFSVAIDPHDAQGDRWLAGTSGLQRLYYTEDAGQTWTRLDGATQNRGWEIDFASSPDWVEDANIDWFSTGEFFFDPVTPERLWFTAGTGIYRVDNFDQDLTPSDQVLDMEFDAYGIEELVPLDLVKPSGGDLIVTSRDRIAFQITDPDQYNANQVNIDATEANFGAGWDISVSPDDPNLLAMVSIDVVSDSSEPNYSAVSIDGGATWQRFADMPGSNVISELAQGGDLRFGHIAVSGTASGTNRLVWFPVNGGESARLPWYSTDLGKTWTKVANANFPQDPSGDGSLLDTNDGNRNYDAKPLVADPNDPNTFYYHTINDGTIRSTDGGVSWSIWSTELPAWSKHRHLIADPNTANDMWFAYGIFRPDRGLWHSTNDGKNWTQINNVTKALSITVGAPINTGQTHSTLYLAGSVDNGSGGDQSGLFRSTDKGLSWELLSEFPGGLMGRPVALGADPDAPGEVYLGIDAVGFLYGRPAEASGGIVHEQRFDAVSGDWTVDVSNARSNAVFEVQGGKFVASNIGNPATHFARWDSKTVNISGLTNVSFNIDVESDGGLESSDSLTVVYSVDGGPDVTAFDQSNNFNNDAPQTITASGLSGAALTVSVIARVSATGEAYHWDNLEVTGAAAGPAYSETFDAVTGDWTTDVSNARSNAVFEVQNGKFVASNIGNPATHFAGWTTGPIDIAGLADVGFSLDIESSGQLESNDSIEVVYQIDGGPQISLATRTNNFNGDQPETVFASGLTGSTLTITVIARVSAIDESYLWDNVHVEPGLFLI